MWKEWVQNCAEGTECKVRQKAQVKQNVLQILLGGHGEQLSAFLFIGTGNVIDKGFHFSEMVLHAHVHAVVMGVGAVAAVKARRVQGSPQRGQQIVGRPTPGHDTGRTGPAAGKVLAAVGLFQGTAGTLG